MPRSGASGVAAEQINFKLFADLSQVTNGSVKVFFYFEQDIEVGPLTIPQLIIAGGVQFGYVDASNNFIAPGSSTPCRRLWHQGQRRDRLLAKLRGAAAGVVTFVLTGEADIIFSHDRITLSFDASLSVKGLFGLFQANNIVVAAGTLVIDYSNGFEVWGAAKLEFTTGSIPFLEQAGISADVVIYLRINTSADPQDVTLHLPNAGGMGFTDTPGHLLGGSFGLFLVGQLTFNAGPVSFIMDGVFAIDFMAQTSGGQTTFQFDMFLFANLQLGIGGAESHHIQRAGIADHQQ